MKTSDDFTPPLENTYWVQLGRLLAGEYPGHWDPEQAARKIEILESAGVGMFVDLTQECEPLEPYQELLRSAAYVRLPIVDATVPSVAFMTEILDRLDETLARGIIPYLHCWGGIGRTGTVVGCWLARHQEVGDMDAHGTTGLKGLKDLWKNCAKSSRVNSPETPAQVAFIQNWAAGQ